MSLNRRSFLVGSLATLAACSSSSPTAPTSAPPSTGAGTTSTAVATTPAPAITAAPATTSTAVPTTAPTTAPSTTTVTPTGANPFALGVASGDPTPDGVILWTRFTGDPGDPVSVDWSVSEDKAFTAVVKKGTVAALAANGFSVHVDVTGLIAGTKYFYRFEHKGWRAEGRTGTLAVPSSRVDQLRFGFASCQRYENGFFTAHTDMAANNLDLVVWLGDYIYEYAAEPIDPTKGMIRAVTGGKLTTLEDYRQRYALYRADPALQASHAACPWLVVWDDHEVENNYAADASETGIGSADFAKQRAVAYQAWWEFMPTRLPHPESPAYKIYRSVTYGSLANIFLLDGRQYRTDQACGDAILSTKPPCPETNEPDRTMLGAEQESWLLGAMATSTTTWNVMANQVVFADATLNGAVLNYDQWDGYPAARRRIVDGIAASGKKNTVIITGDIHLAAVADITRKVEGARQVIATEFVGTSVSSGGLLPANLESAISAFPDLRYLNARQRGWCLNEVTPTTWTATFRVVDDPTVVGSKMTTDAVFRVAPDRPGASRL